MKFARLVVFVALIVFAISLLQTVSSQERQLAQQGSRATQVYRPRINIATEGPISFEEFPALTPGRGVLTRVTNQYEGERDRIQRCRYLRLSGGFRSFRKKRDITVHGSGVWV